MGSSLTNSKDFSRLLVALSVGKPEMVKQAKLWEGTESLSFNYAKFKVSLFLVLTILQEYYDNPEPGGRDGF